MWDNLCLRNRQGLARPLDYLTQNPQKKRNKRNFYKENETESAEGGLRPLASATAVFSPQISANGRKCRRNRQKLSHGFAIEQPQGVFICCRDAIHRVSWLETTCLLGETKDNSGFRTISRKPLLSIFDSGSGLQLFVIFLTHFTIHQSGNQQCDHGAQAISQTMVRHP